MSVGDSTSDRRYQVRWDPQTLGTPDLLTYGQQVPREVSILQSLGVEITDEQIEAQKPGNRGLILSELQGILRRCSEGDPGDPRWDELRLRTLDRLAKLTRAYEPQVSVERAEGDVDRARLADRVLLDLSALESKISLG